MGHTKVIKIISLTVISQAPDFAQGEEISEGFYWDFEHQKTNAV